jgi:hypothetical protein
MESSNTRAGMVNNKALVVGRQRVNMLEEYEGLEK